MAKHMIPFAVTQPGDRDLIDLAFSKKKADDRKEWLRKFKVLITLFSDELIDRFSSPEPISTTILMKYHILSSSTKSSFVSPWLTISVLSLPLLTDLNLVNAKSFGPVSSVS